MEDFVSKFLLPWFIYNSQHTIFSHRSQSHCFHHRHTKQTGKNCIIKAFACIIHRSLGLCAHKTMSSLMYVCICVCVCIKQHYMYQVPGILVSTYQYIVSHPRRLLPHSCKNHKFPCLFNTNFNKGAETVQSVWWLGYRLDNLGFEFRQGHKKDMKLPILQNVHTSSAVHPAS